MAPALVAAGFDDVGLTLTLTFDRAVDASGLVGNVVVVDDAAGTGVQYAAIEPATVLSPTAIEVAMTEVQAATGTGVRLTAGPTNGIVAAAGGAAWAGAAALELPFPGGRGGSNCGIRFWISDGVLRFDISGLAYLRHRRARAGPARASRARPAGSGTTVRLNV